MKTARKQYGVLLLLLLCGILAALTVFVSRWTIEDEVTNYELLLDYQDLSKMAEQSELSVPQWLDIFHDLGVTKLVLFESSLASLSRDASVPIHAYSVETLMETAGWQKLVSQDVLNYLAEKGNPRDVLVECTDKEALSWLQAAIENRYTAAEVTVFPGDGSDFLLLGGAAATDEHPWETCSIGYWPETVSMVQAHGMTIIPRSLAISGRNDITFAKSVMESYLSLGVELDYYLPGGNAILGYDEPEEAVALLKSFMEENGISMTVTEHITQLGNLDWAGLPKLLEAMDYRAITVYNVWPYIQYRYQYYGYDGPEEITNSLYRSIAERNTSVVYLRCMLEMDSETEYVTDPAEYEKMLTDLYQRLDMHDRAAGTVVSDQTYHPAAWQLLLMAIGVVAAVCLTLTLWLPVIPRRALSVLFALGAVGVVGLYFVLPGYFSLLLCIAAAVVMPCLVIAALCRYVSAARRGRSANEPLPRILKVSLISVLLCGILCLCGGILAAGFISETQYLMGLQVFRGVKLSQLLPLAAFALLFLWQFTFQEDYPLRGRLGLEDNHWNLPRCKREFLAMMDTPVRMLHVLKIFGGALIFLVLAVVGYYYLLRTGHAAGSSAVPVTELLMRNLLEENLLARPRTKEFIIGWPCLMLMVYTALRRRPVLSGLFGLGAAIGLVSVVNTFLHIRTSLYISLYRTVAGLILGVVIGLVLLLLCELVYRFAQRQVQKWKRAAT